jgi:hypothetical protein
MVPGAGPGRLCHRVLPGGSRATVGGRIKEPVLSPPLSMHGAGRWNRPASIIYSNFTGGDYRAVCRRAR